jgi:hypothetical protein
VTGVLVVAAGTAAVLAAQAPGPPAPETAATYQGAAAEQFLAKAKVKEIRNIGVGVTLPQRVTLELNGVTHQAAFKTIDEKRIGVTQLGGAPPDLNFQDSWQTEIPAYVVDTIIGLGMVPATVERRIGSRIGSLQWWVISMMPEAERATLRRQPPDQEAWDREVLKMRLFDALIANVDRHANNILVTEDFQLRLIDHSRSFRPIRELRDADKLTRFSRSLLTGLERLEQQDLRKRVGRYLSSAQISTMLRRRDTILERARTLVAERGEAVVIYP